MGLTESPMSGVTDYSTGVTKRNIMDLFSLKGRTIVITGAAGGLGLNFAIACVQAGAHVAGMDIAAEPHPDFHKLESMGTRIKYYRVDVADAQLVESTVQEISKDFGTINGCITCAGIAGQSAFHQYPAEEVKKIIDINLLGSYFVAQSVVRQLLKQKTPGSIILISSVAAHQANRGHPISAYGATKYAVRGLAQQVAAEYASHGIRANSISPGPMLTEMSRRLAAGNPEVFAQLCSHIMLNRMGEPDELNGAAIYLLSDASSFVTGEDILVDGGQGHL